MNITWMIGTILFGGIMAVAALAADRAATAAGWSRRTVWAFALSAGALWPFGAGAVSLWRAAHPAAAPEPVVLSATQVIASRISADPSGTRRPAGLLAAFWLAATLLLLGRVATGLIRLHRLVRAAKPAEVDGIPVLVTESAGPAVCGVVHPRILVPRWFFDLDASLRTVVLRHESEHASRGDARVVLAATLATAVMPWNPGTWWMASRLRLAVELDCDARVLRTLGNDRATHRYSHLLLLVAQRQSAARLLPALAESNAHLERRITAMHAPIRTASRTRVAILGAMAFALTVLACSTRVTGDLTAPQTMSADRAAGLAPANQGEKTFFEFQVQQPVRLAPGSPLPAYPSILKAAGVEGEVLTQFVVEPDGTMMPGSVKILKSTHQLFTDAVMNVLPDMRYTPADVNGKKVRQLVQRPFVFSLATSDASARADSTPANPAGVLKLAPTTIKPPR